ncbi:MAG: T9SS type A sorting domain-containing protein, partial [Chitinophagaceae bacterium]
HIAYYARRGSQMGKVDVYLDDVLVLDDFDLYSASVQTKSLIYSNSNLQNTTHTLRIVNTGLRNTNATANYVNIDFLVHRLGNNIVSPQNTGNALPLTLLSFEGKQESNNVKLAWTTTQEVNAGHFELLHSNGSDAFKIIGRVNAKNQFAGTNDYVSFHDNPNSGFNYYQLKQYDADGKFTFSNIVRVNFGISSSVSVYPNPVKVGELVNLKFNNPENNISLTVMDLNQRVVLQRVYSGINTNINFSTLAMQPGMYILKINNSSKEMISKIFVSP